MVDTFGFTAFIGSYQWKQYGIAPIWYVSQYMSHDTICISIHVIYRVCYSNSQKTSHSSPSRASYGVSIVRIWKSTTLQLYVYHWSVISRILWKKNEVADYEATTFSIFYNNALYLVLIILASFYVLRTFNPAVYPCLKYLVLIMMFHTLSTRCSLLIH